MNLYLVVSEPLEEVVCEDWSVGACHYESYCIAELVVARNRSQARYLAWKNDKNSYFAGNIREMPKMQTEVKLRGIEGSARIVSDEHCEDELWTFRREAALEAGEEK